MAIKEHVELIKEGPEAWNAWRLENADVWPDLSLANLGGANLSVANLSRANLNGANLGLTYLGGANLNEADLSGASLSRANLSGANLSGANLGLTYLSRANLSGANLSRANLKGANLSGANLSRANFSRANLSNATIGWTIFADNDLSTTEGLEAVNHVAPSTIGIDTLYKSDSRIPEGFFRGAGVPEDLITYVSSLVGLAIEFYSCFISYGHQDEEFSRRLHSRMQTEKLRVWFAPQDMKGGKKVHEEIFRAIQIYDKLLLVLSENSMKSEWVMTEIRRARKAEREENRRKLFPIRLVDFETIQKWECFDADGGKDLAVELREYYVPDFSNWRDQDAFESEFAKLLRDLRVEQPETTV